MTGGILGGGVLLGALVLLWVVVLAPGWAKGREFRAAEQNAARLQRTLRVLVDTAAVPEEHVVEATARQALAHEKLLRATEEHRKALRKSELKQLVAQQKRELRAQRAVVRRARLSSPALKPVRVLAALATLLGVIGLLVGLGFGIAGVGWFVSLGSCAAVVAGVSTLLVLAPRQAVSAQVAVTHREATSPAPLPRFESEPAESRASDEAARMKAREQAQAQASAQAQRDAALAKARAQAREAARQMAAPRANQTDSILLKPDAPVPQTEAPLSKEPLQKEPPARSRPTLDVAERQRQLAVQERLRRMGVVGDTSGGMPDLDEALKRRRNVS